MKSILAALGRRAIASGYHRAGIGARLQLADLSARNQEATTYRRIASLGFAPSAFIDVGAYRGDWTRLAHSVFGPKPTLMVEAQEALIPALEALAASRADLHVAHAVLGAASGVPVTFYEMSTGSSLFAEASNAERTTVEMRLQTLDQIVAEKLSSAHDVFLKVDVQGAELEILKGGQAVLERAALVQLEVALLPYNEGAPLLHEVVAWMAERGWFATEVSGFSRPGRHLVQIDLLFARVNSPLRPRYFEF